MASVPNMRPTAATPAGDGTARPESEAATTPFATLLATGQPKPAAGDAPVGAGKAKPGTAQQLLAALQRAITGRAAPADDGGTHAADAATQGSTAREAVAGPKAGDGKDDDKGDGATAATPSADAASPSADLLPLIEAQSAAPVAVTPPPVTPKSDTLPSGDASPRAVRLAMVARTAPLPTPAIDGQSAVEPSTMPAAPSPGPAPAQAEAQAAVAAAPAAGQPSDPKAKKGAPVPAAPSGAREAKADAKAPAAANPSLPQTLPAHAPAADPGQLSPRPAADPAQAAAAAPPPPAADPLAAIQTALGQLAAQALGGTAPAAADPAQPATARPGDAPVADRMMAHHLDLARDSAWLDRLARDIAGSAAADAPMRFRLHPETLGHMRVELTQGDRGTSVRLTVESDSARTIIADAQPRLVAEARAQGVRIAETHVDLAGGSGGHASSDPRRQETAREPVSIRTAPAAGPGGDDAPLSTRRHRSDRYA
jgi:flagellar hook-length control protein FliK